MPDRFEGLSCRCASAAKEFAPSTELTRRHYAPDLLIHSRHIKICLQFDIPASSMTAVVTHTFRCVDSIGTASPTSLDLNAVGLLEVEVRSITEGHSVSAVNTGKLLKLHWSNPFSGAEERQVEIKYRINQPVSGMFFFHPTEEEPSLVSHVITDHETEKARYWLPSQYP
jgi:aminopeptidase N